MLAKTIKSNQPLVLVIIIFLGTILWTSTLVHPNSLYNGNEISMPLYSIVIKIFNENAILLNILAFLLVIIQGFLLVGFNKKFILISSRTYLPALFFILISSSFIPMQKINPQIIGGFFLFLATDFIFRTYRIEYALNEIYLSGFFIALSSLFWAPFSYFIFLLFIALIILRTFNIREWIVSLLGFLTPLFFLFVVYYVFIPEQNGIKLFNYIITELTYKEPFVRFDLSYVIFYILLALLIILASLKVLSSYQSKKIKTRKYFEINWWYFLIGLLIFLIFKRSSMGIIYVLSIPVAFLFTEYFYSTRKNLFLNMILLAKFNFLILQ